MKEIELPIVAKPVCEARLRTTKLGRRFRLDSSFLCAGGHLGKDTCSGDGGSPLVCLTTGGEAREDTWVQAGVVAWGLGCGGDTPGVYAALSQVRDMLLHVLLQSVIVF